ncbi:hypothetical protein M404DRAFT_816504 [Pisolithus tinctorius Marx 270]|uniref:Uncharacterized protein n=1 Tax=Pisolithus tinctorius Marx 270 TaxID=870435 RepID=A0A0C3IQY5_PISTI|nr:hypothetical protein M404DRAFT_816504 [Pisolithus tinctorius Marx 270]
MGFRSAEVRLYHGPWVPYEDEAAPWSRGNDCLLVATRDHNNLHNLPKFTINWYGWPIEYPSSVFPSKCVLNVCTCTPLGWLRSEASGGLLVLILGSAGSRLQTHWTLQSSSLRKSPVHHYHIRITCKARRWSIFSKCIIVCVRGY